MPYPISKPRTPSTQDLGLRGSTAAFRSDCSLVSSNPLSCLEWDSRGLASVITTPSLELTSTGNWPVKPSIPAVLLVSTFLSESNAALCLGLADYNLQIQTPRGTLVASRVAVFLRHHCHAIRSPSQQKVCECPCSGTFRYIQPHAGCRGGRDAYRKRRSDPPPSSMMRALCMLATRRP